MFSEFIDFFYSILDRFVVIIYVTSGYRWKKILAFIVKNTILLMYDISRTIYRSMLAAIRQV